MVATLNFAALGARLRDGAWLTPGRRRIYAALILAALAAALAWKVFTANGLVAADGQPLGTDFSNVYAAGRLVLSGHPASAYDWPTHHGAEEAVFGAGTPYYGWHYPPMFLAVAALLALFPYAPALLIWQGATLPLYLATVGAILRWRGGWLLPALAFPAVFVNLAHGHNGFLTAALIGGGLALLDRRPVLAGVLLGALCYKPQFGVVIPFALAAGGHWRAMAAAGATVIALALGSLALFGAETWHAFEGSLTLTRTIVLEQGSTGWHKIQTVFSAARNWGASIPLAYALQGLVLVASIAGTMLVWRGRGAAAVKAAALIVASLIATPYSLDYDMVVLGPALAFLVADGLERGFAPYRLTLLAAVWVTPMLARNAMMATTLPVGAAMLLGLFAVLAWPAARRLRPAGPQSPQGSLAAMSP